jgi:hypothetical protein
MISDVDKIEEEVYKSQLSVSFGRPFGYEYRFNERVRGE